MATAHAVTRTRTTHTFLLCTLQEHSSRAWAGMHTPVPLHLATQGLRCCSAGRLHTHTPGGPQPAYTYRRRAALAFLGLTTQPAHNHWAPPMPPQHATLCLLRWPYMPTTLLDETPRCLFWHHGERKRRRSSCTAGERRMPTSLTHYTYTRCCLPTFTLCPASTWTRWRRLTRGHHRPLFFWEDPVPTVYPQSSRWRCCEGLAGSSAPTSFPRGAGQDYHAACLPTYIPADGKSHLYYYHTEGRRCHPQASALPFPTGTYTPHAALVTAAHRTPGDHRGIWAPCTTGYGATCTAHLPLHHPHCPWVTPLQHTRKGCPGGRRRTWQRGAGSTLYASPLHLLA